MQKTADFGAARLAVCAVLIAASAAVCSGAAAEKYTLDAGSAKLKVIDGDTVHYGRLKFFMCGINAPEHNMPFYARTTKILKKLFGRKKITAHVVGTGNRGRKIAMMYASGEEVSINEKMVLQGGAKHFRKYSRDCMPFITPAQFDAAETRAKKRRLGIFAGGEDSGAADSDTVEKEYTLDPNASKFRVIDGDTVHYGRLKIRLCGINAPERDTPFYAYTTEMLKILFARKQPGKKITTHVMDIDKHGRKVAVMYADGEEVSINEKMVLHGGAKHFRRFSQTCAPFIFPSQFDAAETRAKKLQLGIWL